MTDNITPIGHIITPFSQKFGIPRQGTNLSVAKGTIVFAEHINVIDACEGIMQFSHLWIIFQFHQNIHKGWTSKVRPPRLGGNMKAGVFATRSSFRPNGLGMSVVKLVEFSKASLLVEGVDMLSGSPIIDIKPYISYADSIPNADSGYAAEVPSSPLALSFDKTALSDLQKFSAANADLYTLIETSLAADPRPAYKKNKRDEKQYHIRLYNIDITFRVEQNTALVLALKEVKS